MLGIKFETLEKFTNEYLIKQGYLPVRISVFDHWLNAEEVSESSIMTYNIALNRSSIDEYMAGEKNFMKLYHRLAERKVVYQVGSDGKTIRIKSDNELDQIITASLREEKLMDIFFTGLDIRVIGGFDRTDLLLLRDQTQKDIVCYAVKECGLHVLMND